MQQAGFLQKGHVTAETQKTQSAIIAVLTKVEPDEQG
jgi:hypothetical protein